MNKQLISTTLIAATIFGMTSCKKEKNDDVVVKAYTVPSTYEFANANYTQSTYLVKMAVELDAYLKKPNSGSSLVSIDPSTIANMYNNSGNPFSDALLNSSGISINVFTTEPSLFKAYADSVHFYNNGMTAAQGVGGWQARGSNKIVVGPRGLEYGQAYTKGVMGAMLFKEAVDALTNIKSIAAKDTAAAQKLWDYAFGLLSVPVNYSPDSTYTSSNPNRPLLWGGYLAERGKAIEAGKTLFNAFLKGRAAIGGYDVAVRNEQADIILAKWEQLAAAAALEYVTSPTSSSNIGNYGSQLHALSEGFGFVVAFKHRPISSKLSASDFETLKTIMNKDFYDLINQTGFTDLVTAQTILKNTYGL